MKKFLMMIIMVTVALLTIVVWDVYVAGGETYVARGGNVMCNKSILASECWMLEAEDLQGMYEGLTLQKK